jgi:hypothetical protein
VAAERGAGGEWGFGPVRAGVVLGGDDTVDGGVRGYNACE